MKLLPANFLSRRTGATRAAVAAFTVVEMVIVSLIVSWLVITLVALQIFALRIYTLAATKTTATQSGREAMNKIRDGIRSAKTAKVGFYNSTNGAGFVQVTNNVAQIGNALELVSYDTNGNLTLTNIFYLYQDPVVAGSLQTNQLRNIWPDGTVDIMAKYVTNYYVFEAEDYQGNDLTNSDAYNNNGVIHITLQFDQWEYPVGFIGGNAINAYDFYLLTSRVTRRCKQ